MGSTLNPTFCCPVLVVHQMQIKENGVSLIVMSTSLLWLWQLQTILMLNLHSLRRDIQLYSACKTIVTVKQDVTAADFVCNSQCYFNASKDYPLLAMST